MGIRTADIVGRGNVGIIVIINTGCCGYPGRSHTADNVASTQETITTYDSRGNVGIIVIINTGCCGYPDGHTLLQCGINIRRPLLRMITEVMWVLLS